MTVVGLLLGILVGFATGFAVAPGLFKILEKYMSK